jgi:hypothetical protein
MRCDDDIWNQIYGRWLDAKAAETPDKQEGPITTGDYQIDQLEAQFYKKYVLKET